MVNIEADRPEHDWIATSLERTTFYMLSGFERLAGRNLPDNFRDSCYEHACQMAWLKDNDIHIYVKGYVTFDTLNVDIYDIYHDEKVDHLEIPVTSGTKLSELKIALFQMMRPFTQLGGILDTIEARNNLASLEEDTFLKLESVLEFLGIKDRFNTAAAAIELALKVHPLLGGFLWGIVLLVLAKLVFPRYYRFEKLIFRVMPSLIKSYILLSIWRGIAVLALMVPVVGGLVALYMQGWTSKLFFGSVLVPLILGLYILGIYVLFEILVGMYDRSVVIGKANKENLYHKALSRYLEEYLSKNDLRLPPRVLNHALFLGQQKGGIATYGGLLRKARIVIDIRLIELAIGNVEDEKNQMPIPKEEIPVTFEEDEDAPEPEVDPEDEELKIRQNKKLKTKFMKLEAFKNIKSFKEFEVEAKGEKGLSVDEPEPEIPEHVVDDEKEVDPDFIRVIEHNADHYKDFLYGLLASELGVVYSRQSVFGLCYGFMKNWSPRDQSGFERLSAAVAISFDETIAAILLL